MYVIHTRKKLKHLDCTPDITFRIWCTVTDSYVTKEMCEKELRETELNMRLERAVAEYFSEIDGRVERAIRNGTSARNTTRQNIDWDRERE